MSIASEITRLQEAKADLKTAIEGKGVTVPSTTRIDGYADLVDDIQTGGGGEPNLQDKSVSYTPTESQQTATVTADSGYDGLDEVSVTVGAIDSEYVGSDIPRNTSSSLLTEGATVIAPSGYYENSATKTVQMGTAGTPTASKGAVSNHSVSVTPSVTNQAGYIYSETKTGTAVSVSASELVSGSETKTQNGTYDVTNLAEIVIDIPQGENWMEETITTSGAVTKALDPHVLYHFTGALTSLTITLNAPATGEIAQYHFDFLSGSTAPTLTMPNAVTMPDDFAVEASKRYEVDVLNDWGTVVAWAN